GTPENVVIGTLGYRWARVEWDVQSRWQSHYQDYYLARLNTVDPREISSHVTLNTRLAYHFTDSVSLALTAEQLNQRRFLHAAGAPVERGLFLALGWSR